MRAAVSFALLTPPECEGLGHGDGLTATYRLSTGRTATFGANTIRVGNGLLVAFDVSFDQPGDLGEIQGIHALITCTLPTYARAITGQGRVER